jgi:hypothetical protein
MSLQEVFKFYDEPSLFQTFANPNPFSAGGDVEHGLPLAPPPLTSPRPTSTCLNGVRGQAVEETSTRGWGGSALRSRRLLLDDKRDKLLAIAGDVHENAIVARLLPSQGWVCTRDGCGKAFATLSMWESHARAHNIAPHKRKRELEIDGGLVHQFSQNDGGQRLQTERQFVVKSQDPNQCACASGEACCGHATDTGNMRDPRLYEVAKLVKNKRVVRTGLSASCGHARPKQARLQVSGFSPVIGRKLKGHARTHANTTGSHRCLWRGCFYATTRAGDLKEHSRTHTGEKPFACSWEGCKYISSQAGNLKRHTRIHTGERLFVCTWAGCGQRASTKSNLMQHLRTHTGEKPFLCAFSGCEYSARHASSLKKHVERMHEDSRL